MIQEIEHNSSLYWELVSLRDEILRKPLHLIFSKEELLKELDQHHFAFFDKKEIVAGFILVKTNNKLVKMRQVCVSEHHQRKGIGSELMTFAEQWSKEKNFKFIYCHARQNALDFYLKQNYQIEGNAFLEVGLEHYKLIKEL